MSNASTPKACAGLGHIIIEPEGGRLGPVYIVLIAGKDVRHFVKQDEGHNPHRKDPVFGQRPDRET